MVDESHAVGAAGARDVPRRPLAQADARRVRVPPAVGARQPAADLRGVRGAARARRSTSRRPPAPTSCRSTGGEVVEQVVRPTGLRRPGGGRPAGRGAGRRPPGGDPRRASRAGERVLVTTLTKRMAEDLTEYYRDLGVRVEYLHSDVETLERVRILRDLRRGEFDVLVGVNLLREGLDLPEVSLVAILDADKEGYLRSEGSLIQTIGRAARHVNGTRHPLRRPDDRLDAPGDGRDDPPPDDPGGVQPRHTGSRPRPIRRAIDELMGTPIAADYSTVPVDDEEARGDLRGSRRLCAKELARLEKAMRKAAERLDFEEAAEHRDRIRYLRENGDARVSEARGRLEREARRACPSARASTSTGARRARSCTSGRRSRCGPGCARYFQPSAQPLARGSSGSWPRSPTSRSSSADSELEALHPRVELDQASIARASTSCCATTSSSPT